MLPYIRVVVLRCIQCNTQILNLEKNKPGVGSEVVVGTSWVYLSLEIKDRKAHLYIHINTLKVTSIFETHKQIKYWLESKISVRTTAVKTRIYYFLAVLRFYFVFLLIYCVVLLLFTVYYSAFYSWTGLGQWCDHRYDCWDLRASFQLLPTPVFLPNSMKE